MNWHRYLDPVHWHPAANLFPLLPDNELDSLAENIRANGLQNPVVLLNDKVLDGRNRLRGCAKVDIKPQFLKWHENGLSALDYVVAQNLERRHLSFDQRVALAAKLVPEYAKAARARQIEAGKRGGRGHKGHSAAKDSGKAAAQAASRFPEVSARSVEKLLALERKRPGTVDRILAGETTLAKADKEIHYTTTLAERFGAPPFSVLDAKQGYWLERQRAWMALGIRGEEGRGEEHKPIYDSPCLTIASRTDISVCNPALTEIVYRWFCRPKGRILDPFAGGSTRGIVAAKLGYGYTGIELRREQVEENRKQARKIGVAPSWRVGDSAALSQHVPAKESYDLIFTSPPYYNLEPYSKDKRDGSTFGSYEQFMAWFESIFRQAVARLKDNRFVVVQVGEIRDERGFYRNFVGDTVACFMRLGLHYYNEMIFATPVGSLPLRDGAQFYQYRKVGKGHQNVLCFYKGDNAKVIPAELGVLDNTVGIGPVPTSAAPATLTPIEKHAGVLVKRDDTYQMAEVSGGKVRTCWYLAEGARGLVTAGSRSSPQANIVAQIARHLGIRAQVHTPTGALSPELIQAREAGAEIVQHGAGYNNVICARAKDAAAKLGWRYIPFGMECAEAVQQTRTQVRNVPSDIKRLVIPVGSGMSLAGVLWGLKDCGLTVPVLGVVVGADPRKRLAKYAPPGWESTVEMVASGSDYHKPAENVRLGDLVLDSVYEAKALPLLKPGDLLWVVGIRRTAGAE